MKVRIVACAILLMSMISSTCAFSIAHRTICSDSGLRHSHKFRGRGLYSANNTMSNTDKTSTIPPPTSSSSSSSPTFSPEFQLEFEELMHWRRDVRRFQANKPVPEEIFQRALSTAFHSAPSVGLSEPWRIIRLQTDSAKQKALHNFETMNQKALEGYINEDRKKYASLKLSGMKEAPIHIAVFCDDHTMKGKGLGAKSMPEMKRYSVVSAITLFWLSARSAGLGVGWVSILDPLQLKQDLNVNEDWTLVGYLCVGYPEEECDTPELERFGWEERLGYNALNVMEV